MPKGIEKGTFYIVLSNFFAIVFSYLMYLAFGRFLLSKSDFGIFGVVTAFVFTLDTVLSSSICLVVSRFVAEQPTEAGQVLKKALLFQLLLSALVVGVIALFSGFIGSFFFNDAGLGPYISVCSLLLLSHPLYSIYLGCLNGSRRFIVQGKLRLVYSFVRPVLPLLLFVVGFGLFGALSGFFFTSLFLLVLSAWLFRFAPGKGNFELKRIVFFAVPFFLFNLVMNLMNTVDLFAVKALSDVSVSNVLAGYYTAALTIARLPTFLVQAMTIVLFPLVAASVHNRQHEKTGFYIKSTMRYSLMIVLPLSMVLFATSKELVLLLYGPKLLEGAGPLPLLAIALVFYSLFFVLATIITIRKPVVATLIGLISLSISILLNFLLVPVYSMGGAALASLVAMLVAFIISACYVLWKHKALLSIVSTAKIFVAAAIVFALSFLVQFSGAFLIVWYAIIGVVYFALLVGFRELKAADFKLILNMLR